MVAAWQPTAKEVEEQQEPWKAEEAKLGSSLVEVVARLLVVEEEVLLIEPPAKVVEVQQLVA